MSQQPPPPPQQPPYGGQPPYGAPPPYAAPPKKPRPRALWFVVGGVLLVLAPLVFVGALFSVLRPLTQEDAVFRADETPITVELPANEERAVFNDPSEPADCTAVDGSGQEIEFRSVTGEFTYNEWTAVGRFDTGDGEVTFECGGTSPASEIRIAQLPSTGTFIAGLLVGLIVPLVLGLVGIVILIVTGVLWATRPPRPKRTGPPSEPGTPAS
jgi:hypothetical protein